MRELGGLVEARRRFEAEIIRACLEETGGNKAEAARRIDLERLAGFELSRIPGSEGIYCFHGRSREVASDERIFVLADLRSRSPDEAREADLHIPAFERAFYEASRSLRGILTLRDPKRRLQWNRIVIFVAPEVFLDSEVVERLANRVAPATRHLGLEKVLVRLNLLDREAPERPAQETEIVISDITGSQMDILWREARRSPLLPRSEYERRVVEARRRRLVYPFEIIRMLTGHESGCGLLTVNQHVSSPTREAPADLGEGRSWPPKMSGICRVDKAFSPGTDKAYYPDCFCCIKFEETGDKGKWKPKRGEGSPYNANERAQNSHYTGNSGVTCPPETVPIIISSKGDKWPRKGIHRNRSSTSSGKRKYCLTREKPSSLSARSSG